MKSQSIQDTINKVRLFHDTFGITNELDPVLIDEKIYKLRHNLMEEENNEYLDACKEKDLIAIADALGDKLVILCGTILAHGMDEIIEPVFNEIMRSNMSKLDADGNVIYREDGKILKSDLYTPPQLTKIVENAIDSNK